MEKLVEELKPLVVSDSVDVVNGDLEMKTERVEGVEKGTNVQVGAENMYFEGEGGKKGGAPRRCW